MRSKAVEMLEEFRAMGVSDYDMLDHIICRYLSSDDAIEILEDIAGENDIDLANVHDDYIEEEEEEEE